MVALVAIIVVLLQVLHVSNIFVIMSFVGIDVNKYILRDTKIAFFQDYA